MLKWFSLGPDNVSEGRRRPREIKGPTSYKCLHCRVSSSNNAVELCSVSGMFVVFEGIGYQGFALGVLSCGRTEVDDNRLEVVHGNS